MQQPVMASIIKISLKTKEMIFKPLLKWSAIFICFICLVATIQTATAIYYSHTKVQLEPADLVVVLPGDNERITAGLATVERGFSSHFMIIGKTEVELNKLMNKSSTDTSVTPLAGGKSRSTFEDVYQTVKTIKEHNLKSVIVVTSGYHLPRALFLINLYLKASKLNVAVQAFPVQQSQNPIKKIRLYKNEIVKLCGSFTEMVLNLVTGELVLDVPQFAMLQKSIKKYLT
jgi:hypothetical protein